MACLLLNQYTDVCEFNVPKASTMRLPGYDMSETIQFHLFQDAMKLEREAHRNSSTATMMMSVIRRVHLLLIQSMIMIVVLYEVTFLVLHVGKKKENM
jgi:hypothetical protein